MSDPITASILIGAAVGGGSKLVQGKGIGDIVKGAALGGATGGVTGGMGSLLGAGAGAGSGLVGEVGKAGLSEGITLAPSLVGDTALSLAPTTALGNTGMGISLANSAPTSLLDTSFNPVMQNLSSTPLSLSGGGIALPQGIGTGLEQGNIGSMPNAFNEKLMKMYDKYGTVQNLTGAANAGMEYSKMNQPRPMQAGGQVTRGQAPSMDALMALQKSAYQQPQRKKINFSLLG